MDIVQYSFDVGERILARRSQAERKHLGQFLTPPAVARYMARQLGPFRESDAILDPAIGSGVLVCAVIERLMAEGNPLTLQIDGYEVDPELARATTEILEKVAPIAEEAGINIRMRILNRDFTSEGTSLGPLFDSAGGFSRTYDHVIANPPYFKLNKEDHRIQIAGRQVPGHTNIYTLFMALSLNLLVSWGWACFIVPRSFCSGAYFATFRKDFIHQALPVSIHLFESRNTVFKHYEVLQENIILTFQKQATVSRSATRVFHVNISTSQDGVDFIDRLTKHKVASTYFLGKRDGATFFRLPVNELDRHIIDTVDLWSGSLQKFGLAVSTGPVVAFRAKAFLVERTDLKVTEAVPLLWIHNVHKQQIEWPVCRGNKPQSILLAAMDKKLLVPVRNYVLLRRFSAKEERRRLTAAPLIARQFSSGLGCQWIGLENHLNYIYRKQGELTVEETIGLSALLNSALMDRYFRIVNGNTQVNAAELRALPLPPWEVIQQIGQTIAASDSNPDIDQIVFTLLRKTGYLSKTFPTIKETRITMNKIQEAQEILRLFGLPAAQQNEISALTLLALAHLSENTPWNEARNPSLRIHDILVAIGELYGREYAENTRETIRRQVIHQFEQAGLIVRNPDDPGLPTNSPRTHYALNELTLDTLRAYGSPQWRQALETFVVSKGTLLDVYQRSRDFHKVPLRLAEGEVYHLSPGRHNALQAAIVEEFGPRFAPGALLLYLGDTTNKILILDEAKFANLGVLITNHDKLPDIVLYDEERDRVFLIEAVTSHGPISPKRRLELEEMFANCASIIIYITAFPDFATYKSFADVIAWETEVWIAETPDHLIHFNGEHFLDQ
ncbi:MAG TPA: BsuBI/PstI family type II restriction endonuclease [Anaerolineae bacterium]|nr:BsuBI/PstI family type II restriction endonuclease [Anaerolineae bacterium]HQK12585.1 BsuBI/PstI family type II restriction endonuclease [Anaerolineae bacterium]